MTIIPEWTLGDRLAKARKRTGMSQEQFGAALGGYKRSTVANFETGVTVPKELVVREWSRITDVPEWWLWGSDAPDAVLHRLARTSGWTYGAEVIDLDDWARRSDPIYVPGQIDLFAEAVA